MASQFLMTHQCSAGATAKPPVIRILCQASPGGDAAAVTTHGWSDADTRFIAMALPPIVLIGITSARLTLAPDRSGPGVQEAHRGAWVRDLAAVGVLVAIFDSLWAAAKPPSTEHKPADAILPEAETAILRLLADGLTYPVIARQLGVSCRTIDRRVAQLMIRLGVKGRFQAVREATRLGWL